jgi:hypothetical protein
MATTTATATILQFGCPPPGVLALKTATTIIA